MIGNSSGPWFMAAAALPPLLAAAGAAAPPPLDDEAVEGLRQRCEALLANEVAAFDRELRSRSAADYKWIQQVKRSGTTSDKVAAITLQVQVRGGRGSLEVALARGAGSRRLAWMHGCVRAHVHAHARMPW